MSGKQNKKNRTGGTQSSQASAREEKRAQFEQPKSLYGASSHHRGHRARGPDRGRGARHDEPRRHRDRDGDRRRPELVTSPSLVSQVNDGKAHFYSFDSGGTTVNYFVLADKNGKVRVALDACEVCFAQKKGYHQEGDTMVCNNCGKVFPSDQINVITGGCNPIPVDKTIAGGQLTITSDSLAQGVQYF